tara:strand:- start:329 stop:568 length:240 start_codon:yes stop_codon:yes gene_type:complete
MIRAVSDIVMGRNPIPPIPREVNEYFMVKEFTGWTIHYIRSLSSRDYKIFSTLASVENRIKNQLQEAEMKKAERASKRR